jgi:hypothetical protein
MHINVIAIRSHVSFVTNNMAIFDIVLNFTRLL